MNIEKLRNLRVALKLFLFNPKVKSILSICQEKDITATKLDEREKDISQSLILRLRKTQLIKVDKRNKFTVYQTNLEYINKLPRLVCADTIQDAYNFIEALQNKIRMSILNLIEKQGELDVKNIWKILDIDQSQASQHISVLFKANLLLRTKIGKNSFYRINTVIYNKLKKALA